MVIEVSASEGTATLTAGGTVTLPVYNDTGFTPHEIDSAPSSFGNLSGVAHGGADRFAAYLLNADGDHGRQHKGNGEVISQLVPLRPARTCCRQSGGSIEDMPRSTHIVTL